MFGKERLLPSKISLVRPHAAAKFLFAGSQKFYVQGVTYGTFERRQNGVEFPSPAIVENDFRSMAENGVNAIRVYTAPPLWLLDLASDAGLRVMAGIPWEQHISFLDDADRARDIERRVRAAVRACAGHPAILCYSIGNEIPASIVRWAGWRRVECYLRPPL